MIPLLVSAAVLLTAAAALWGWGRVVLRTASVPHDGALTVAVGLAVVLFLGGLVNLARLAHAPVLWTVVALGLGLAAREARSVRLRGVEAPALAAGVLIVAVVGFAAVTQLPPTFFNPHDDFEKYFAHPVRMLATGALLGSPLSALGLQTFGGAAWLHGFVVSAFPIEYLNGVDAVFGLGLLLCLGAAASSHSSALVVLVPLLLTCIEPQSVNVSPLYLCAALMATAVRLTFNAPGGVADPRALGLVYGALVALKPTCALFAVVHVPLTTAALGYAGIGWRVALFWALRVSAWSILAIAPWIALHAPHYLEKGAQLLPPGPPGIEGAIDWFSSKPLFFGGSMVLYTLLAAVAVVSCAAVIRVAAVARLPLATNAASALSAIVCFLVLVWVLEGTWSDRGTQLRYAIPFLLGVVPVALAQLVEGTVGQRRWPMSVLFVALSASFLPSAIDRYGRAAEYRSITANLSPEWVRFEPYFQKALGPDGGARIRTLQGLIPERAPMVAWVSQAFHLDFARNPVSDVDPAGLTTPWAHWPAAGYVLWEYRGPGVRARIDYDYWLLNPSRGERRQALMARAFLDWLDQNAMGGDVLHVDDQFVVYRLVPGRSRQTLN